MNQGSDPTLLAAAPAAPSERSSALGAFGAALRERPLRSALGLGLEYAMYASAVGLALALLVTRVPMRSADRALGWRMRERFVDLLARISPG